MLKRHEDSSSSLITNKSAEFKAKDDEFQRPWQEIRVGADGVFKHILSSNEADTMKSL
jgi:hypothetical protein